MYRNAKNPAADGKVPNYDDLDMSLEASCLIGLRLGIQIKLGDDKKSTNTVLDNYQACRGAAVGYKGATQMNMSLELPMSFKNSPNANVRFLWAANSIAAEIKRCVAGGADYSNFLACSCKAGVHFGAERVSDGDEQGQQNKVARGEPMCRRAARTFAELDDSAAAEAYGKPRRQIEPPKPAPSTTESDVDKDQLFAETGGPSTEETPTPTPSYTALATPEATPTSHWKAPTLYDNYDLAGSDISHAPADTVESCISACRTADKCEAVTFDKWNKICFLKGDGKTLWFNAHGVSAFMDFRPKPDYSNAPMRMSRAQNRSFPKGGEISLTRSVDACEAKCAQTDWCAADTFYRSTGECMLLRSTGEYFPDNSADSGVKRQKDYK